MCMHGFRLCLVDGYVNDELSIITNWTLWLMGMGFRNENETYEFKNSTKQPRVLCLEIHTCG